MRKSFFGFGFFLLFISFVIAGCATTNNPSPAKEKTVTMVAGYPEGYQDWTNTCSKVVLDKTSPFYGFQRVLVDEKALPAYKNGGQYPEGSRLVLEFNEPIPEGPEGDVIKGPTNWLALMIKDSTATKTGGWIFEAYNGPSKTKKEMDVVTGCYNCHTAMKSNNYVFSKYSQ